MRETLFQLCIMNICMIQIWRINTSNYIERKWIHTDVWRNYSQITTKKCRKVKVLVTQLCSTLCDPMSLPGSSVHGILQARYWSELLFPPPGNLPGSGIEPRSPVLQADCLPSESPGKPSLFLFSLPLGFPASSWLSWLTTHKDTHLTFLHSQPFPWRLKFKLF